MQIQFGFFLILAFTAQMALAETVHECKNAGGQTGDFVVTGIKVSQATDTEASLNFSSNRGPLNFTHVSCKEESSPDKILVCEDEHFSFIISLEEVPAQAALNPFVFENKEYGPFYFYCEQKN